LTKNMFDRKTIDSWQNISILSFLINKTVIYTVKPVLSGSIWDKVKVALYDRWPLKRGSIHMKFSMIKQEKGDILTQVTA
jgi:hypothetical protein